MCAIVPAAYWMLFAAVIGRFDDVEIWTGRQAIVIHSPSAPGFSIVLQSLRVVVLGSQQASHSRADGPIG